ncbi:MAG: AAA family ATPase [Muribaculaceae bacterium]|nr:AAA family ATPase [Muribaculaceae bacterium]MDE7386539.1 AAA family ATPase [Muribaculaceae bacterium]
MRINSLKIRNFRGFENETFDFDPKMTVVVGNNTTGKTTLLNAVQIALGAYLKSLHSIPTSDKAYSKNFTLRDVFKRYIKEKKDFFPNPENTRIDATGEFFSTYHDGEELTTHPNQIMWWRELRGTKTTHSRECAGEMIDYVEQMEAARSSQYAHIDAIYPLVLSFGVKRIDNDYRSSQKTKLRESRIEKAYKSALLETIDFKSAFDWLYRFDSNLSKEKEFAGTKEAFINALADAIPAMSEVEVDSKNNEFIARVSVTGEASEYQTFDNMSDGFKAIISIVAEIAYRCIELNGFLGIDAIKKTPGVVIIDEVDLYLHPRWQRHILADLQKAFPLIQFIVSSHSPFIIQSVENKNIITLDGKKGVTDANMRSIEEITMTEMDLDTRRSAKFDEMVNAAEEYYQLVKSGEGDSDVATKVKQRLDEIEVEFSDDPAYVAMLKMERSAIDETDN